jgi:hypothetical protein
VAGVAFDMVCASDACATPELPGNRACARNVAVGDNCRDAGGRIDFTRCARLVPGGLYRVAVNDYIAAGGSGFEVLKRNTSKQDTGISLRDALRVYLSAQARCPQDREDEQDAGSPRRKIVDRYGAISCLDERIEQHDGRILPVFQ